MYKKRLYRTNTYNGDLTAFKVRHFESDLLVYAHKDLSKVTYKYLCSFHEQIKNYCLENPEFEKSLIPVNISATVPVIVRTMHKASVKAGVGPMAAVAGAVAEAVGKKLLKYSKEIIVENGGDIFMAVSQRRKIGIFAGIANIYNKLVINILPAQTPCGICTSSGQFGHSLSLGKTCATIVISKSCALADAYATAFGNMVNSDSDIDTALKAARREKAIKGIIIINSSKMAAYGDITFDLLDK